MSDNQTMSAEPWLRGGITDLDPLRAAILYSFRHAREDIELWTSRMPEADLCMGFGNVASVGFHVRHIAGSVDRLMTYVQGQQLTDEQIRKLIARGGVIGAALDAWMLYPGWVRGKTLPEEAGVTLETVVDHIDRVCQLAGNARHAAIGTDLDGGFGSEQSPHDLDTIADLQRLPELLRKRGYGEEDVTGILHGNWVRFFREAWK